MYARESLLELALKDSESSIKADPSWLLGYFTKATSLAELERKHEALASPAVFNHLSSGRDISSVTQRYGALQIHDVETSDELRTVLQKITERDEANQIVLLKEGDYLLEKTVEMKPAIVIVGFGKVTVSCKTGAPVHFRKEYVTTSKMWNFFEAVVRRYNHKRLRVQQMTLIRKTIYLWTNLQGITPPAPTASAR